MCSKRDYEKVAAILADARKHFLLDENQKVLVNELVDDIASGLASYFADRSTTFDKTRFYAASSNA